MTQLDLLAFAAHPDDVELCAGGTMCLLAKQGYSTGIVDLSQGELGSRGTPALRKEEAAEASKILGISARVNLGMPDGDIQNTKANQLKIIETIRRFRPHIILLNAPLDRHPDHGDAAELVKSALFYAGLIKVETRGPDGTLQEPWRPDHALHYMQSTPFEPTMIVDVSDVWTQRMEAMQAFKSQFFNPGYKAGKDEPQTFISNPEYFKWIEARARTYGYMIGATYGEPFLYNQGPIGVTDLFATLSRKKEFK
ncbi:MAG: bacillithiol biosynthesis deacetylase BshB1 [Rhodothermales bacterium]